MNRGIAAWLVSLGAALAYLLPNLAGRPMHAGEIVLAGKLSGFLETGSHPYDPQEYHGPALAWAAARIAGVGRCRPLIYCLLVAH